MNAMMRYRFTISGLILAAVATSATNAADLGHDFNGPYTGRHLSRVAFPIGGIGSGMFCLEGSGAISHMSVRHKMEFFHEPSCFAAICVLGQKGSANVARVVEGPIPDWKYFGRPGSGNGSGRTTLGLPRFRNAEFLARFPFATIKLSDPLLPLDAQIVGWSPFTPPEPDPSSLPVGALEYCFRNPTDQTCKAVFSFNSQNFMGNGSLDHIDGGFILYAGKGDARAQEGAFAFFVDDKSTVVDHCWFRGGWWDPLTITWNNVAGGTMVNNPPQPGNAPGASLFVPFELKPGEEKTIRLMTSWYVPTTTLRYGTHSGPAFRAAPSHGTAKGQQSVSGFLGRGLVNTFDPDGDSPKGTLTSPDFSLDKRYLHFLVGGGDHEGQTCVNLLVDGKALHSVCGKGNERLAWTTVDLQKLQGKQGRIQIVDRHSSAWGHVLADHFILSDEPIDALLAGQGAKISADPKRVVLIADFEGKDYGKWQADPPVKCCACSEGVCKSEVPSAYVPWYSRQFDSVQQVAEHWRKNYAQLRQRSEQFRDAFYDTTLPDAVVEAVAANLTILKSPTVLRQHDGRLWCFEGCCDSSGCCAGSCTHVWNYAQAICHLFPSLERSLRQTEYYESLSATGRQAFRANLPIAPGGGAFDASDGQLGGIMKAYREWRIAGDELWLTRYWPRIQLSLDYMIAKYDPRHTGLLEEEHHNTYDINYFGPDGHCGSFYLGALAAAAKMGEHLGKDVTLYRQLLAKGRRRMGVRALQRRLLHPDRAEGGTGSQLPADQTRRSESGVSAGRREGQRARPEIPVRHRLSLRRRLGPVDGRGLRPRRRAGRHCQGAQPSAVGLQAQPQTRPVDARQSAASDVCHGERRRPVALLLAAWR